MTDQNTPNSTTDLTSPQTPAPQRELIPGYALPATPVYLAPTSPKGLSITSMVLGLVSIALGFTFVVPVVGLILGIVGLQREPAGKGMALTGVILSGLILLVWVVIIGFFLLLSIGILGTAATVHPSPSY